MTKTTMTRAGTVTPAIEKAWLDLDACFGKFCLTAGIEALQTMLNWCSPRAARQSSMPMR